MRRIKFSKAQNKQAVKMHRKCWAMDQKKMRAKKHVDRIENGIYVAGI